MTIYIRFYADPAAHVAPSVLPAENPARQRIKTTSSSNAQGRRAEETLAPFLEA